MSNDQPSRRYRFLPLTLVIGAIFIIGVGIAGILMLVNLGRSAPPPPQTTLLPTFSPPQGEDIAPNPPPDFPTVKQLPDPENYTWKQVATGFERPLFVTNAGDASDRLFIVEQAGVISVLDHEQNPSTPFLDIRDRVGSSSNEQGLLGLAFHPNYRQNGYFFVNYTDQRGDTVIARYRVSADPNLADPGTETRLLQVRQPYTNHNGGSVFFGPDGYLYLGLGDGGAAADPEGNAQSLDTYLGKLLRIDVDHGDPYAIPPDNPFAEGGGLPEIWAYGLRNPWRFSFDALTGDLYIGDVGQNTWEEIDFLAAGTPGGANFGWDYLEASHPFESSLPQDLEVVMPVAEYTRDSGCSVTGGFIYRGAALPAFYGVYLFGDYCSGNVWGLLRLENGDWQERLLFETGAQISSFGVDQAGEIYLVDHNGAILQLIEK